MLVLIFQMKDQDSGRWCHLLRSQLVTTELPCSYWAGARVPELRKAELWPQVLAAKWFICRAPSQENGPLMLWRPKLLHGFQARVFKDGVRGGGLRMHDQHVGLLLIGWGEVTGWGYGNHSRLVPTSLGSRACGQHEVTILHLGGGLSFYRTQICIRLLSISLQEELGGLWFCCPNS